MGTGLLGGAVFHWDAPNPPPPPHTHTLLPSTTSGLVEEVDPRKRGARTGSVSVGQPGIGWNLLETGGQ